MGAGLDVLPELVGPPATSAHLTKSEMQDDEGFQQAREFLQGELSQMENVQDRIDYIERLGNEMQMYCVSCAVVVVDQEAFVREKLKIIFADTRGNTVRYAFTDHDGEWYHLRRELDGGQLEFPEWNNDNEDIPGGVGDAYRVGGSMGKELYLLGNLLN